MASSPDETQSSTPIPLDPYTFGKDQTCFGCGPHNAHGLQLKFTREGDCVRSRFTLAKGYDGPPGILHGGLQAMILDEIAGWTLVGLLGRIGLTSSMNVRYLRSMRLDQEMIAEGRIVATTESQITVKTSISQQGKVGCIGRVSYHMPDCNKMKDVLQGPLPPGWDKFFTSTSEP
jgi:uncharacterized protein (TIGR00369 family)